MFKACKDCEKRYVGCHGECETYKAEKAKNEELREKRNHETFVAFGVFESNHHRTMAVMKKRRGRK